MMRKKTIDILSFASRLLLGLTFMFSGAVKAIDPLGTTYKIEDYLKAFGGFFTDLLPLAETAAFVLIAVECILGICLVFNIRIKVVSWLSLLFYLVMTPLTLYLAIKNPVSDCGCFGDAVVLTNWQTFAKNVVLLCLVIVLFACRKAWRQTFVWQAELLIVLMMAGGSVGWMFWTLNHLPVMDFRPYKIGNNIVELMEYPEDAPEDVYEYSFVYEKDGVEQEFTLENYPKGDSTWTFVRQNSKLIQKGYEPPIHDFEILTEDYEDITYEILESEEPVTLAVLYDLQKTDIEQAVRLNALYEQCLIAGQAFYVVTGSGTDDQIAFRLRTNADYPICTCDPVTLKTIVRANPGIVVIQNGMIIDKYNLRNR